MRRATSSIDPGRGWSRTSLAPVLAPVLIALACVTGCGGGGPTAPNPPGTREQCLAGAVFGSPASAPYCLPWASGTAFEVGQAYCSPPGASHHRRYAYDFMMPMDTEVLAARAGIVVELREHWPDDDPQGGHENMVSLRHDDDTISLYIHMRQDGVLVEMGDSVPRGGLLGWSGSSGTSIPHLHFQVCLRSGECSTATREVTLPVSFRNAQGPLDPRGGLAVGTSYTALPCQ